MCGIVKVQFPKIAFLFNSRKETHFHIQIYKIKLQRLFKKIKNLIILFQNICMYMNNFNNEILFSP